MDVRVPYVVVLLESESTLDEHKRVGLQRHAAIKEEDELSLSFLNPPTSCRVPSRIRLNHDLNREVARGQSCSGATPVSRSVIDNDEVDTQ